uniref:Uncharacterized protein n=1 Tax=Spongospora subterranea TaxID=70186 RepID=A0A0H5QNE5_9EUKA|eukprot:CRZ03690.1 hypothetical protein [Spongospora subterranea]
MASFTVAVLDTIFADPKTSKTKASIVQQNAKASLATVPYFHRRCFQHKPRSSASTEGVASYSTRDAKIIFAALGRIIVAIRLITAPLPTTVREVLGPASTKNLVGRDTL